MAAQQQRAAATLLQRQQQQAAQQQQQQQQINAAAQTASIRARNRLLPKASLPNPVAMRNASIGQNALPRTQIPSMNLPNHYSLSTNAGGAAGQFLQVRMMFLVIYLLVCMTEMYIFSLNLICRHIARSFFHYKNIAISDWYW